MIIEVTFVGLKWYKTTITTVLTSSSNTTTTTTFMASSQSNSQLIQLAFKFGGDG